MSTDFEKIKFKVGDASIFDKPAAPRPILDDRVLKFLGALSTRLAKYGRKHPDLMSLSFFLRGKAMEALKERYADIKDCSFGIGTVFHSSPSNVPANFAYSMAAGLLCGNVNYVRLPKIRFEQTDIICSLINELFSSEFCDLKDYVCAFECPTEPFIIDFISARSNGRVIFGGDANIQKLQRSPLKPGGRDLAFKDRFSACIIDAVHYLKLAKNEQERLALAFYNDTYLNDQNACSSPSAVLFLAQGREDYEKLCADSSKIFFALLAKEAHKRYSCTARQCIAKLETALGAALASDAVIEDLKDYSLGLESQADNVLMRVKVFDPKFKLKEHKGHSGLFYEYHLSSLSQAHSLFDDGDCQSVTYIGEIKQTLQEYLLKERCGGVYRIVPAGQALAFDFVWDGIDLIRALSNQRSGW